MENTIDWTALTELQKNATIAEKIMGWKWVSWDYYAAYPTRNQQWLLPSTLDTKKVTPGNWVWYTGESIDAISSIVFPQEHQDKRIVPVWLPRYTTDMNDAWDIVDKIDRRILLGRTEDRTYWVNFANEGLKGPTSASTPQEAICIDALRILGYEVKYQ